MSQESYISLSLCIFNLLLNWQKHASTKENILSILKKNRNLDSTKVIPNIFRKYNLAFKLFLLVITIWYFPTLCCFIEITSEHIGYRQMTEIISLKYGVNISKEHVRKRLFDIGLEGVSMRKKKTIKRRTYETNGPFDVFHIDGNYKWKGLVSSFASVLMDLVGSWFGCLCQPQIMILLLLQISALKLLKIWAEHQIIGNGLGYTKRLLWRTSSIFH